MEELTQTALGAKPLKTTALCFNRNLTSLYQYKTSETSWISYVHTVNMSGQLCNFCTKSVMRKFEVLLQNLQKMNF